MTEPEALRALLAEVERAGACRYPVRLAGTTFDLGTGELWTGTVPVACKDRRSAVCPACAARYAADAWHLVAAGLRGGKGVPSTVVEHPAVFATLTAPSFGAVHTRQAKGPCHPRRKVPVCPHGTELACTRVHADGEPVLGEPLCPECFDYPGAVLWNAHAGRLFDRTMVLVRRALARAGGLSERAARDHVRLSYLKVAEFQRRGLVHFHVVARVDGPDGPETFPPPWAAGEVLAEALRTGASVASVARVGGGTRIGWGTELDLRVIGTADPEGPADPVSVAAYLAKYSIKSSESSGALAHRLRSLEDRAVRRLRPHSARLVTTAWDFGGEERLALLGLRLHAHTFGFPGHFATKSARYSTTFGALRAARAAHHSADENLQGSFRFLGHGYPDPRASRLAEVLNNVAERASRRAAGKFPATSPGVPQGAE